MFLRFIISLITVFLLAETSLAERIGIREQPPNSMLSGTGGWTFFEVLAFIEGFLLKVVLPIVIVGTGLYIAYELFLAEGNEEKNKKAWKAITFGSIGVISIALAYAVIAIASRLSI